MHTSLGSLPRANWCRRRRHADDRPATWNGIVGMRPTAGLVGRGGVYGGWPSVAGSLGPMARTVTDLAKLLDVMVGYDSEDPLTARGVGHVPASYTHFLDRNGLKATRLGILREPMGFHAEPGSEDFKKITESHTRTSRRSTIDSHRRAPRRFDSRQEST
jgi:amidase